LHSYRWNIDGLDEELIEIPLTTMPIFRIPFHISYILYIYSFSPALARFYFRMAIGLCYLMRIHPSLIMHPLDFLGCDDVSELSFFPAMNLPSEKKLRLVNDVIDIYSRFYTIVPLQQFAEFTSQDNRVRIVEPAFNFRGLH
jgi:hypothetical protein